MPVRSAPGADIEYYLTIFDEQGRERSEPDGGLLSRTILKRLSAPSAPVSDIFLMSHGWKGDLPAAIAQYDAWIGAMIASKQDVDAMGRVGFKPLIIGMHWPSLPWGNETIPNTPAILSVDDEAIAGIDDQVEAYASSIANTPAARGALLKILEVARQDPVPGPLTREVREAYSTLFTESGLALQGVGGAPGADQGAFDPEAIVKDAARGFPGNPIAAPNAIAAPGLLGFGDGLVDIFLSPLRQLSFWKMKGRARQIGESAAHELLRNIMLAAPAARIHLMGHSFGCIVVSASIAGTSEAPPLPKPVDTLFLAQGALSIWAYTEDIPYARGTAGYFHRILKDELVSGPIVTTRSKFDTAVGFFYPLGAGSAGQIVLAAEDYPPYGGLGAFGIQAVAAVEDRGILPATSSYNFEAGLIYNLEASDVIKNGRGVSGAHNDIAHAEVAHAFWQAVLVARPAEFSRGGLRGGTFNGGAEQKGQQLQPPASGGGLLSADARVQNDPYEWEREQQRREQRLEQIRDEQRRTARSTSNKVGKGSLSKVDSHTSSASPNRELLALPTITELRRWINVEVEGTRRAEPLTSGVTYRLVIDVDVEQREGSVGVSPLHNGQVFAPQEVEVTLTVQLDSEDFVISKRVDSLVLQREGRSSRKASFEITPLHNGTSKIKVTIHREGNFIQQMELSFDVGAPNVGKVALTALGRPPSAVGMVKPRDIGLSISPAVGGYDVIIWGAVMARARLPLNPADLAKAVDVARSELMKVVMRRSADNKFVFQSGIDVPDADRDFALTTMARAGATLFRRLFWGPSMAADANKVGDFLRRVATDSPGLKLQVLADSAPIPWGMLYLGDASDGATLGWENFLGMRHVIEMIPLQNTLAISAADIPSDQPKLAVSVNMNRDIDRQMGINLVAQQERYWGEAGKTDNIRVIPRATTTDVVNALASGSADEQIIYFYCHAKSADLADSGGPDSSCLVLSDGGVTLGELSLNAPTTAQLRNNPLVFINACESAELSPAFYDGFVPYFMAKGARGVIGTECKVPALFAAEWAARFFTIFLEGKTLGETFLLLRREFLENHGNPLGLLYAVHCDGDTRIAPPITRASLGKAR